MPSAGNEEPATSVLPPLVNSGAVTDLRAPQVAPPVAAPEVAPAQREPAPVAGLRAVPGDGAAAIEDVGALQAGALAALASSVALLLLRLRAGRARPPRGAHRR
ncbi:hypothetical protein [Actinomadura litoris]|uniref:hypothetical protein n=1 Tax=Actinomadura litoris TaxID=2678616 RepID=UPI001FA79E97|nr:hypothetical protein [Actinomadura litoris]